jgi:hypothetical protein
MALLDPHHPPSLVVMRRYLPPAPIPTAGIDRPRLSLPYVVIVCFRCFSRFEGILQLCFYGYCKSRSGDVAHVASVSEACWKCLFKMFYLFLDICCNRFYLDVAYDFTHMFATVCFKCFGHFSKCFFMLQLFILMFHMFHTQLQAYVPNVLYVSNVCCI